MCYLKQDMAAHVNELKQMGGGAATVSWPGEGRGVLEDGGGWLA